MVYKYRDKRVLIHYVMAFLWLLYAMMVIGVFFVWQEDEPLFPLIFFAMMCGIPTFILLVVRDRIRVNHRRERIHYGFLNVISWNELQALKLTAKGQRIVFSIIGARHHVAFFKLSPFQSEYDRSVFKQLLRDMVAIVRNNSLSVDIDPIILDYVDNEKSQLEEAIDQTRSRLTGLRGPLLVMTGLVFFIHIQGFDYQHISLGSWVGWIDIIVGLTLLCFIVLTIILMWQHDRRFIRCIGAFQIVSILNVIGLACYQLILDPSNLKLTFSQYAGVFIYIYLYIAFYKYIAMSLQVANTFHHPERRTRHVNNNTHATTYRYKDKVVRYRYLIIYIIIRFLCEIQSFLLPKDFEVYYIISILIVFGLFVTLFIIALTRLHEKTLINGDGLLFYIKGRYHRIPWHELSSIKLKVGQYVCISFYGKGRPATVRILTSETDTDFEVIRNLLTHIVKVVRDQNLSVDIDKPILNFIQSQDSGIHHYIKKNRKKMVGAGGWLSLISIAFFANVFYGILTLTDWVRTKNWDFTSIPSVYPLINTLLWSIMVVYSIFVLITLFGRKRGFPKCITVYAYLAVVIAVNYLAMTLINPPAENYLYQLLKNVNTIVLNVFLLFALKKYLAMSLRVKNTYIDALCDTAKDSELWSNNPRPIRKVYRYPGKRGRAIVCPLILMIIFGLLSVPAFFLKDYYSLVPVVVSYAVLLPFFIRGLRSKVIIDDRGIFIKRLTTMKIRWDELSGIHLKDPTKLHVDFYCNTYYLTTWKLMGRAVTKDLEEHKDMLSHIVSHVDDHQLPVEVDDHIRALINSYLKIG